MTSLRNRLAPLGRWLGHRDTPWFVSWMITEACNYRCDHCGCWREPPEELSTETALSYAEEMVQIGVLGVSLCGGEVTLRPDLGALLRTLSAGGITTRITSNGRLVPDRIDDLRTLSRLKLSLDGPPGLQDEIRGDGAFDAVLAALEAARGAGIPVQLNTVLTASLIAQLDAFLVLVRELGCEVSFNPLEDRDPAARAGVDAVSPAPADLREALDQLIALSEAGDPVVGNSLGTLQTIRDWPRLAEVDCHAGRRFCRVLVDGRVASCDRSYAPTPPPEAGAPLGFALGVAQLQRAGTCQGCWRNNTIELNRSLSGAIDALQTVARWGMGRA